MIDRATIDKVIEAADIAEVVGKYVPLRKKGSNFTALCPFHDDGHDGNFIVYPRGNVFKCFACDAKGDAVKFVMMYNNVDFPTAIAMIGAMYGIPVEGADAFGGLYDKNLKPREKPKPLPILYFPTKVVTEAAARVGVIPCTFINYLHNLPWASKQAARVDDVLEEYRVGVSRDGRMVFWRIDIRDAIRTGKIMKFMANGHRDHERNPTWVHKVYYNKGLLNPKEADVKQCLFGEHLISKYPQATIKVVESEKTALMCAIFFGNNEKQVWVSCGGKTNLTTDMLLTLRDTHRPVALVPDVDAMDAWRKVAADFGYQKMYVDNTMMMPYDAERDGPKADWADVIERLLDDALRVNKVEKLSEILPRVIPARALEAERA